MSVATTDVVVIGGGVVGSMCALQLAEDGHRVTVLDEELAGARSCTVGSAGMIVPSHVVPLAHPGAVRQALRWMLNPASPLYVHPRLNRDLARWGVSFARSSTTRHVARCAPLLARLHLRSRELYEQLSADSHDSFGLTTAGLLMLCTSERGLHEERGAATFARGWGIPADVLDSSAAHDLEPSLGPAVVGAVRYPMDAWLDPRAVLGVVQSRARDRGVVFAAEPAQRITTQGSAVTGVRTAHRAIACGGVVLAAGARSPTLAAPLGLRVLVEAGRGYSVDVPTPQPLLRHCALHAEGRIAITPFGGCLRVGGTMEITDAGRPPSMRRVESIRRAFDTLIPGAWPRPARPADVWSGMRPVSADGMPLVGASRVVDGLIVATGHGMMGVSLAPVTAELVAAAIDGNQAASDPLLDPDRFSARALQRRATEETS